MSEPTLIQKLQIARIAAGLSFREAEHASGIPKRQIRGFENGCWRATPDDVRMLAEAYGDDDLAEEFRLMRRTPAHENTSRHAELLAILIEECAEVQHPACKALRFGLEDVWPERKATNRTLLSEEVGDLLETIALARREGLLHEATIENARERKRERLARHAHSE